MIIDRSKVNQEQFLITEHTIGGEQCFFIRAQSIMTDWTEDNLHLRSVVINSAGEIISASYPKFFNFHEHPAIFPFTGDLKGCSLIEKVDGSTLIVSKYKGELIVRTRGSIDVSKMENGDEVIPLLKSNGLYKDWESPFDNYSYIFEWVSPKNKIVISYDQPQLIATNMIDNRNYKLANQKEFDLAACLFGWKRPKRFEFNTLTELLETVKKFESLEGVCLYYDNDQHIRKVKSDWYLKAHAFKSRMSLETILALYQDWKPGTREEFENKISTEFDFECLNFAKPLIGTLYDKLGLIDNKIQEIKNFINENKELSQKDFALKVKSLFTGPYSGIAFGLRKNPDNLLDGHIKTLILEVL